MNLEYKDFISYLRANQLYADSYDVYKTAGKHALIIINKIFSLMNSNKYNSLDDLIKTNNYEEFLNVFNLYVPIKEHSWGSDDPFNEENFKNLIQNIKKYIQYKMSIDKENTFPLTGNQIYENSQIHPIFLNDIDKDSLNNEELMIYEYAVNYQIENSTPIRVDMKNKVLIDKNNNIIKINFNNDANFNSKRNGYQKVKTLTNSSHGGNIYGQPSESSEQPNEQSTKFTSQ